jgi:hypothetical protein
VNNILKVNNAYLLLQCKFLYWTPVLFTLFLWEKPSGKKTLKTKLKLLLV